MFEPIRAIFICHTSEDKDNIVRPLVAAFTRAGASCWYDEAEIQWGDSITQKVNEGLAAAKFAVWFSVQHLCGKTGRKEN